MTTSARLSTGPFEHASMDYARLREEGLRLLGRLAGAQWTDFNTHDPGVTILEQLCYAITDLGYRMGHPMPELLAGGEPWLPGPEEILTTDPVTAADVRRLAIDGVGVRNAWLEEAADPAVPLHHHASSGELRFGAAPDEPDVSPVRLRGVYRVLVVQDSDKLTREAALKEVATRLHAARGLGSDFEVVIADSFQVGVRAVIEVGAVEDPVALMAEIVESVEAYLTPPARFLTLADARFQGRPLTEILDGPLLAHGFIAALPGRSRSVYASDLIHAIQDVPGVKVVRSVLLKGPAHGPDQWALEVPTEAVPILASAAELTLLRNGLPLRVDLTELDKCLIQRRAERAAAAVTGGPAAAPPRPRDLKRHRSIRYQLPAAYGVGPLGLPASASPERVAQARQLAAYLLIFDQLFSNTLAQLAHARDLLSPGDGATRTYFADPVEDERLGIAELRVQELAAHRDWLADAVEPDGGLPRRQRFLAHLLARFAEELGEYSQLADSPAAADRDADAALIASRSAFLRDYARLSRARGSGCDVHRPDDPAGAGGFEERLRHKLGLRDWLGLHVVEHVLLRPIPEDQAQLAGEGEAQIPLLAGMTEADPWSLKVSVVIEDTGRHGEQFEQFVERTIAAEIPAHLSARLHWFGGADWSAFEAAWSQFRDALRDYRASEFREASVPALRPLRLRDARDRVIDLLGFGRTYPLRDLPLPSQIVVSPGSSASIPIGFSQQDVTYELRDRATGRPIPGVAAQPGTGGPIRLDTPRIDVDASYRILAVKQEGAQSPELRREAWLRTVVRVVEGVDSALVARIRLPLLDPRIDNPSPSDARLGDFGVRAEIEVLESQAGVSYEIIEHAADLSDLSGHRVVSAERVIGTSGTIVLRTVPMEEDIDLRVRAQKTTGDAENPVVRTGILDLVLPLRVRANPAVQVRALDAVMAHGGTATVRLESTQESVEYRVFRGRVRDRDFVRGAVAGVPTIDVPADGRTVRIRRPDLPADWEDLPGFSPVDDATRGTGGTLELAIGAPVTVDTLLLVQANKRHSVGPLGTGSEELPSAVQLADALAVLVRPDPARALRLEVTMADGATTGTVGVRDGQPGVLYELRLDGTSEPIGRPAYFHQRDDVDARLNKGIDQLAIEVDAVVARDRLAPEGDPRDTPPAPPVLDTAPLPAGTVLRALARKVMSGLEATLEHRAVLDAVPEFSVEPPSVAHGDSATIMITASRADERYELLRDGQTVGGAMAGTGAALNLSTGPLMARAIFTLAVTRIGSADLEVERRADIVIEVLQEGAGDGANSD